MNLRKLSTRIVGILIGLFLVALTAIGLTLFISWQLEDSAAAINNAESQRMRTNRMVYLPSQQSVSPGEEPVLRQYLLEEVATFDRVMADLEHRNPARPLFLPKETSIEQLVRQLRREWDHELKPQIERLMNLEKGGERLVELARFRPTIEKFVALINRLVAEPEISSARSTQTLRLFKISLIAMVLGGSIILMIVFFSLMVIVIRPVEEMWVGLRRMAEPDFTVRLNVRRNDEFGELGEGFNRMTDRLEGLYGRLEQRVQEKTRDIEEKHRELTLLYEVAASLSQPAATDELCRSVLDRVMMLLGAQAGLVRLVDDAAGQLRISAHRSLSDNFVQAEASLPLGGCLCGIAAVDGLPISRRLESRPDIKLRLACRDKEGFSAMVAIPIGSKNQVLGIFNLFFYGARTLTDNEVRLLETVGQHLGVAIENQRLVAREKEMAVSEERNLLAQELHDSIAQSLAFLNIQAQMLQRSLRSGDLAIAREELVRMREGIQESYDNVRELMVHFRIRVDHADLDDAIRSTLEKFEGQTGIRTTFEKHGAAKVVEASSILQILHILQEALSNIRKHAAASFVQVLMQDASGETRIAVHDDGIGFDPGTVAEENGAHVGIGIMRERAHRIGARLELESAPGRGSCVTLLLPGRH